MAKQGKPKDVERVIEKDRRALYLTHEAKRKGERALQGANNNVSRCQIQLASATQDFNETLQRLARTYKLGVGDVIDAGTGAVRRAPPATPAAQ